MQRGRRREGDTVACTILTLIEREQFPIPDLSDLPTCTQIHCRALLGGGGGTGGHSLCPRDKSGDKSYKGTWQIWVCEGLWDWDQMGQVLGDNLSVSEHVSSARQCGQGAFTLRPPTSTSDNYDPTISIPVCYGAKCSDHMTDVTLSGRIVCPPKNCDTMTQKAGRRLPCNFTTYCNFGQPMPWLTTVFSHSPISLGF